MPELFGMKEAYNRQANIQHKLLPVIDFQYVLPEGEATALLPRKMNEETTFKLFPNTCMIQSHLAQVMGPERNYMLRNKALALGSTVGW